ncbi:MAG TPA: AMP-binding protein, partial [Spongiibacteraceae bacterium]|nr:AMP-binding protein [Spongiibacteraceae bacterium]
MTEVTKVEERLSLVSGIPLSEEKGLGPLTLGGYVKEIAARFGDREAAVMRLGDAVERWSYNDLLARSMEVARALVASGVTKGTRVGVLATNRLEFLSCMFGTTLAGGVATCLSTFSTPAELEFLLQSSACSVLLLERHVLKKDFAQIVIDLEPAIGTAKPGDVVSLKFPYLHHLAILDSDEGIGAIDGWSTFLARGNSVSDAQVDARAGCVTPADPG